VDALYIEGANYVYMPSAETANGIFGAGMAVLRAAKAHAYLNGRTYATPHDVKSIAPDVLRHRVALTYEAEAQGKTPEDVIERILLGLLVP